MMGVGATWTVFVPSDLGYPRGLGDAIPPRSPLVFEITILDIEYTTTTRSTTTTAPLDVDESVLLDRIYNSELFRTRLVRLLPPASCLLLLPPKPPPPYHHPSSTHLLSPLPSFHRSPVPIPPSLARSFSSLPLRSSSAVFLCSLPLQSSSAVFLCGLPLRSSSAVFLCELPTLSNLHHLWIIIDTMQGCCCLPPPPGICNLHHNLSPLYPYPYRPDHQPV